jgi:hypothetical protein
MAPIVVNGMVTSYDLPNYVGDLFQKRKQQNAFLRLIGGLSGGVRLVSHWEFPLGVEYEVPDGSQKGALEGAAPVKSAIGIAQTSQITQIFHEGVEMTYTAQSQQAPIAGLAVIPGVGTNGNVNNPKSLDWQIQRKLDLIQNDMNYAFMRGVYQKPVDNTTVRRTRGVATAVVTNLFDRAAATYDRAWVVDKFRTMMDNRMFPMGEEIYALGTSFQLEKLANFFVTTGESAPPASRTVVGLQVRTVMTMWATIHLVYEPTVPNTELYLFQPQYIRPVAMPTVTNGVAKGILFAEPLAKTGSSDAYQLYGEWGIDYTSEVFHARFINLPTT